MTQEQEELRLIHKFMGTKVEEWKGMNQPYFKGTAYTGWTCGSNNEEDTLKNVISSRADFRTNWKSIMQIVEKIETASYIGARVHVTIGSFEVSIYCSGIDKKELCVFSFVKNGRHFTGDLKIQALYEGIIQFIKWWNNDKS